ncbi:hypothetical protein ACFVFS_17180 [Kitasatospora sp. NPDC057692]|uniref:hypothetical protein n=1 Tax=Kitasatospora sp. NPDC057692 TaxID=3346215 RepID=UPI0036A3A625
MTDRTTVSPEEPEAEEGTGGYCRVCGDYGYGVYAGMRTALTDWITRHKGCTAATAASPGPPDRGPGDVWA